VRPRKTHETKNAVMGSMTALSKPRKFDYPN
jgi:hypothetical protein